MSKPSPRIGLLMVILGAVIFGSNGAVTRAVVTDGIDVWTYTSFRMTGGFIAFVIVAAMVRRSALRLPDRSIILPIIALGIFCFAAMQWTLNFSVMKLPLGVALLLHYLAPVIVVLWVRFARGNAVAPRTWPAIGLALLGLALVGQVWQKLELNGAGVLAGFLGAGLLAAYFLLGEHVTAVSRRPADPIQTMMWALFVGSICLNFAAPFWEATDLTRQASLLGSLASLHVPVWVLMLYIVVVGTVLSFFLYLSALKHLPSQVVSTCAMFEPVVAVLVGWLWFNEVLSAIQILGVAFVVTGIIIVQSVRRAPEDVLPPTE